MSLPFEFADTTSKSSSINENELQNGEIVDVMLLEHTYPSNYVTALNERNTKEKLEAEELGVSFVPNKPSYKDGGISWKYAVIRRARTGIEPDELVFKPSDTGFIEPEYVCYGQLSHLMPLDQLRATSKNGTLYGDLQREGGTETAIGGLPAIKPMFDSVKPSRDDSDKTVPVEQRMTADRVPKGQEERYASILQKESIRKQWWNNILKWWKGLTEEQAFKALNSWVSHRLLLCKKVDTLFEYLEPEAGMIFRAQINRLDGSKYFNINTFSGWKTVNGKWKRDIYSTCEVEKPTEEQKLVAQLLIKTKEEGIERRKQQMNKTTIERPPDNNVDPDEEESVW